MISLTPEIRLGTLCPKVPVPRGGQSDFLILVIQLGDQVAIGRLSVAPKPIGSSAKDCRCGGRVRREHFGRQEQMFDSDGPVVESPMGSR